ncbi:hypothetical protein [Sodalis-like endosymbiont of Proechinophthirus fluctus]|uniref:hypothetical protein n=1 Tax=Sodalis-like endosymbiont of Proechinophthirus fluctus TaxID=1462730 RepID=UPI000AFA5D16|nr:hypothetical protein [Sodalis-like endosymbiont of Proechinophthirus fluctus]
MLFNQRDWQSCLTNVGDAFFFNQHRDKFTVIVVTDAIGRLCNNGQQRDDSRILFRIIETDKQ